MKIKFDQQSKRLSSTSSSNQLMPYYGHSHLKLIFQQQKPGERANWAPHPSQSRGCATYRRNDRSLLDKELYIEGVNYRLLTSTTSYDPEQAYFIPSNSVYSEILYASKNDPTLYNFIKDCLKKMNELPKNDTELLCKMQVINDEIKSCFSYHWSCDEVASHVEKFYKPEHPYGFAVLYQDMSDLPARLPLTPLSYWMNKKVGVCRHKNFLGFILIGEAQGEGLIKAGEIYAITSVMPLLVTSHIAIGYKPKNSQKFYLIDFTRQGLSDLSVTTEVFDAMQAYGLNSNSAKEQQAAIDYVLDIMARFDLKIDLYQLRSKLGDEQFCKFFYRDPRMKLVYLQWVINNLTVAEPNELPCLLTTINNYTPPPEDESAKYLTM